MEKSSCLEEIIRRNMGIEDDSSEGSGEGEDHERKSSYFLGKSMSSRKNVGGNIKTSVEERGTLRSIKQRRIST